MSVSTGSSLLLTDFTAYELPTKKWMELIRPKMRLCVRVQNRDFVSPTVTVEKTSVGSSVHWHWSDDARPSFPDDEVFEVQVQRRFLLGYKCIRRTKPMSIDQVRTGDHCALPLYDGQHSLEMLEDKIEIGEITFALRSDVSSEDASSQDMASFAYSGEDRLAQGPRTA
jgi:hypothetical protein